MTQKDENIQKPRLSAHASKPGMPQNMPKKYALNARQALKDAETRRAKMRLNAAGRAKYAVCRKNSAGLDA